MGNSMCYYTQFKSSGVWRPVAGEKLHAEQEFNSPIDKFAVKVIKKQGNSLPFASRVLTGILVFLAYGGKIWVKVTGRRQLRGGMKIPCLHYFK